MPRLLALLFVVITRLTACHAPPEPGDPPDSTVPVVDTDPPPPRGCPAYSGFGVPGDTWTLESTDPGGPARTWSRAIRDREDSADAARVLVEEVVETADGSQRIETTSAIFCDPEGAWLDRAVVRHVTETTGGPVTGWYELTYDPPGWLLVPHRLDVGESWVSEATGVLQGSASEPHEIHNGPVVWHATTEAEVDTPAGTFDAVLIVANDGQERWVERDLGTIRTPDFELTEYER